MKFVVTPQKKIALCFVVGVLTAGSAWWSLNHKEEAIQATQKMTSVLRARKYIPAGHAISADLVEEVPVPEAFVPGGMKFRKADLQDTRGRPRFKSRVGFPKGDAITASMMTEESASLGLAWILEPGQVALSVRLAPEDAVAGLLKPGDRVHVIATAPDAARLLLSNVSVGAVGDRVWDPSRAPEPDDLSKPMASESLFVTLIVTPEEALRARFAAGKGALALVLLSPLEKG